MTDTQLTRDHEQLDGDALDDAAPRDSQRASRRFRASTYDDALATALDELGPQIQVVEANRIRRGGLGGFFATDLGVEITVVPDEQAAGTNPGAASAGTGLAVTSHAAHDPVHGAIRPYLPEDLGPGGGDEGSLGGQALGMTDARLQQLLDRTDRAERVEHEASTTGFGAAPAASPSFADHLAIEAGGGGIAPGDARSGLSAEALAALRDGLHGEDRLDGGATETLDRMSPTDQEAPIDTLEPTPPVDGSARADDIAGGARPGDPAPLPKRYRPSLPSTRRAPVARSAPSGYLDAPVEAAADDATEMVAETIAAIVADTVAEPMAAATLGTVGSIGDTGEHGLDETLDEMLEASVDSPALGTVDAAADDEPPTTAPPVAVRMVMAAGGPGQPGGPLPAVGRMAPSGYLTEYPPPRSNGASMVVGDDDDSSFADESVGPECAVVVPMAVAIDEPMKPLTTPPDAPAVAAPDAGRPALLAPTIAGIEAGSTHVDPAGIESMPEAAPVTGRTELVAAATDRLVNELGKMMAADGSDLDELDRLHVAVTTNEGSTIEMTLELADERD